MELKDFVKGVILDIHTAMEELLSEKGLVYDIDDQHNNQRDGIHKVIDFDVAVVGSGSVEGGIGGGIKVLEMGVKGEAKAVTTTEQYSRVKFSLAFFRKMEERELNAHKEKQV